MYNDKENSMIAIRLNKEIEQALDFIANAQGSNRSVVIREAILRYLEDQEDLDLINQARSEMRGSKSLKQLRKELGLER